MILLTDEEIARVGYEQDYITKNINAHDLCKAQLKKVYDWGNEDCKEHHATYTPKHQCVQCMSSKWQALL